MFYLLMFTKWGPLAHVRLEYEALVRCVLCTRPLKMQTGRGFSWTPPPPQSPLERIFQKELSFHKSPQELHSTRGLV